MRVLLLTHRLPPDGVAGVERVAEDLADGLSRAGEAVTVATRRWTRGEERGQVIREVRDSGALVDRITGPIKPFDLPLRSDKRISAALEQTFFESNPDVLHVLHLIGLDPHVLHTAHRLHVPVIVSLHDFFFLCPLAHLQKLSGQLCAGPDAGQECASTCFAYQGPIASALRWPLRAAYFRRLLELATFVVAPSNYVADRFFADGMSREQLRIIPNGIPAELQPHPNESRGAEARCLRLAYIGSVVPHKGVDLILDAIALSGVPSVTLTIAGDQPDSHFVDRLRRQAAALATAEVLFHGSYDRWELPGFLDGHDAVVIPSRVPESFSLTAREALALGIPPVVAHIGALPEAIHEGVNGWSFTPDSATDLGSLLNRLWQDPKLLGDAKTEARLSRVVRVPDHICMISGLYRKALELRRVASASAIAELDALRRAMEAAQHS